jgi:hypothetical protein
MELEFDVEGDTDITGLRHGHALATLRVTDCFLQLGI